MKTPSAPSKGSDQMKKGSGQLKKGARKAGGEVTDLPGQVTALPAQVTALPGRVAGLVRLLTLRKLLRAVPVVAAAGAGLAIGRRTARKR
ncbi:hypothetical protein [Actinomadura rubrisoli]|uniref:Uncharacterized protein n=1 Tax=Actinomadura rubrisoli TaxID=2530368 RepID=A0A4R5CEI7_9ACTN|nr:hypothetical protein [Actinomadura rubrisoli]TDD96683.1 hypothetical protein E1298_02595 [Actinomadura rubrisoli]